MMDSLKEMLESKKFKIGIGGIVVVLAAKLGFDIDNELAGMIAGIICTMILGQGLADTGKSAAKVSQETTLEANE